MRLFTYRLVTALIAVAIGTGTEAGADTPLPDMLSCPPGETRLVTMPDGRLMYLSPKHVILLGSAVAGRPILGFYNRHAKTWIGTKDRPALARPLWTVVFRDPESGAVTVVDAAAGGGTDTRLEKITDGVTRLHLLWNDVPIPDGQGTFTVEVVGSLSAKNPDSQWWISVVPGPSVESALWKVVFPALVLGPINASPDDDCLTIPCEEGRSAPNPSTSKIMLGTGSGFGATGPASASFDKPATTRYGGIPYPGQRGKMQFNSFYEKQGDHYFASQRKGAGLYFATHDPNTYIKLAYYTADAANETLTYEHLHLPANMGVEGTQYHSPFPFVFQTFNGDWFDACMIYKQWAKEQYWSRAGTLAAREDVPQWFVQIKAWAMNLGMHGRRVGGAACLAARALGGPIAGQWYVWNKAGVEVDWRNCDRSASPQRYYPEAEGVRDIVARGHALGVRWFPYFNASRQTNMAFHEDGQTAAPYAVTKPDGNVFGQGADGKLPPLMLMCYATDYWQRMLEDSIAKTFDRVDFDGVYLDVFSNGFIDGCYNPKHGHPIGGGNHQPQAQLDMLGRIRNRIGHDVPIVTEGGAEHQIADTHGRLVNHDIWQFALPLYSAVYHEYSVGFGHTQDMSWYAEGDPGAFTHPAWVFISGLQPGRLWWMCDDQGIALTLLGRIKTTDWDKQRARFAKKIIDARFAANQFMTLGTMQRPPIVKGKIKRLTTKQYFSGDYGPVSLPQVMGSTWISPDGAEAVAFANCSDRPTRLVFKLDMPSWRAGKTFVRLSGDDDIESIAPDESGWCSVIFPPRAIYIFSTVGIGE